MVKKKNYQKKKSKIISILIGIIMFGGLIGLIIYFYIKLK